MGSLAPERISSLEEMPQMNVSDLLLLHPEFHQDGNGGPISWAIGGDVLEYLGEAVGKESFTM